LKVTFFLRFVKYELSISLPVADDSAWWKAYLDEPEKFGQLSEFSEQLRVFVEFVEAVLYDELETLQMNRDELRQELDALVASTDPAAVRDREESEAASLRAERDALSDRVASLVDQLSDLREKCSDKEGTVHELMEEKNELEQRFEMGYYTLLFLA
jgi:chromosome segregation ATPase